MSRIKRVHCGDVNCHLVQGEQGAILVDTGRAGYGEKLLPLCRQWDVRLIVLTHGHLDHVQNAAFLSQQLEVPIAMHRSDLELLEDNDCQPMQAHRRLGRLIQSLSRYLEDGDDLSHFGVNAQVVALPGHTAGSIGLKTEDGSLLVGDAMFRLFSPAPALVYADRRQMEDSVAKICLLRPRAARPGVVKTGKTDYTTRRTPFDVGGGDPMTRAEFDAIFEKCKKKYLPTNQAEIQKKLSTFADKDGKVSAQALAIFSFIETVQYTNDMLYAVLSEALDVED